MGALKTALVLSAGGMFGAYQAGVWKALNGVFRPDIVAGASVGALNAWAIAGGCGPEELIRAWLDPDRASLVRWTRLQSLWRGLFDSRVMEERIGRLWAQYRPRLEIGIVAVEVPRLRRRLFRGSEIGWEHLAASCAVLGGFPPRRLGGKLYSDGGLLGVLPLWAAVEMGAKQVVAVNALETMPSLLLRQAVRMIQALAPQPPGMPRDLELFAISPSRPLGSLRDAVFWNRTNAERWIELGIKDAAAQNIFFRQRFERE